MMPNKPPLKAGDSVRLSPAGIKNISELEDLPAGVLHSKVMKITRVNPESPVDDGSLFEVWVDEPYFNMFMITTEDFELVPPVQKARTRPRKL